ncbi:succinyl-diaminopimelate desuccinylase [Rhodobium gokarnense]|uniref:Succinyl-diaminopimelate desuccinylase n=1 Tax=Rhodobium gokarnense TaxID=364296 RepID=A0ABT3H838_9HYPH|nr:succinyl-diaminopimelate desuccinylase [Rhodobium gokarnense]MCW2306536.1 succinyl-diaminopimelate desuccinylase [Rhodobium gokarnense]
MTDTAAPTTDPIRLARDLLGCPSVTPEEGGALAYLDEVLSAAGFTVHRMVFSEPGTPDVENLYARIGSGAPHLTFAGHTDVVPVGDAAHWSHDPFAGTIVDGVLYGRGAVDMKGGIAAFLAAALRFLEKNDGFSGSISFLITGDEEGPAVNGTRKLLDWCTARGEAFDAAIVGEPTNPETLGDAIKIGRRGSLSATLTVTGTQGHAAYQHLADNPIPGIVRLIDALIAEPLDGGTEHFQPSNLEVTSIDVGNPAFNVIPAKATARFNIRFNDTWTTESLKAWLTETLDAAAGNSIRYDLAFEPAVSDVFRTEASDLIGTLSDAIAEVIGRRPELSTNGGTSDARFIKDVCPVVEFGLVGQTMHQVDERVPTADLDRLSAIYERFLDGFFAAANGNSR